MNKLFLSTALIVLTSPAIAHVSPISGAAHDTEHALLSFLAVTAVVAAAFGLLFIRSTVAKARSTS